MNNPRNIVEEILGSPHLRRAIEDCVRENTSTTSINQESTPTRPINPTCEVNQNQNSSSVRDELRRLFPSIGNRQSCVQTQRQRRNNILNNRGRRVAREFNRDIILVKDPEVHLTLTGRMKGKAYEEGIECCLT